jgi:hypothetical protein
MRLDIKDTPDYRAWSIVVNTDPKYPYAETFFLPDHAGQEQHRIVNHLDLSEALRFTASDDISALVDALPNVPFEKVEIRV